jgi:hypothetical protein
VHIADAHIAQSNVYGGVKGLVAQFIAGINTDSKGGITQVYKIGDRGPAGGIVFYDKGNNADGWRYLEAAPQDLGRAEWGYFYENSDNKWALGPYVGGTSTAIGSGKRNTQLIVDALKWGGYTGKAAQLCASYTYSGYSDWFLPSQDELDLMYKNLAAKGLGSFTGGWYWSSSQYNSSGSWEQRFSDGYQANGSKSHSWCVRAVRAF